MEWWQQLNQGQIGQGQTLNQPKPGSIESLNMATQAQQVQQPQVKQQGIDPRAWISEIGGTVGAIGGGLIGTPLGMPYLGAGLGGAAGSALGKVIEQKVKNEPIKAAPLLTESLLSGVMSYGPLRAAGKLTGISATKALQELGAAGMSDVQRNLLKNTLNVFTAAKAGGEVLSEAKSNKLLDYMISKNLIRPGTTTRNIATALSSELDRTGASIGNLIKEAAPNVTITAEKDALRNKLVNSFNDVLITDWNKNTFAKNIINKVDKAQTPQDLWNILQISRIPSNMLGSPDVTATAVKQFSDKTYNVLSKTLKDIVPGYQGLAADYMTGKQAWDFIGNAARKAGGMSQFNRIPLPARTLERVATTVGMIGTQTEKPGISTGVYNLLNPQARQAIGISGLKTLGPKEALIAAKQGVRPAIRREIGATIARGVTPTTGPMPQDMMNAPAGQPYTDTQQAQIQSPYPYQNLVYDMQRDPKNATKYVDYYNQVQKLFEPPKLSATQQQRAVAAQNALRDIPMVTQAIQQGQLGLQQAIPGAQTRLGQRVLGTGNLQGAMFNIMDNILRARTGAAMPESEVKRYMMYLMPTPYESQQTQLEKLQRLVRELQGYANPSATQPSTLEDLLMQQSGGTQ